LNKNQNLNGIIFGATGNIGEKLTFKLAERNCNLIIHGRTKKKLLNLGNKLKKLYQNISLLHCDFSNSNEIQKLGNLITHKYEKIHFFVSLIGDIKKLCPLTDLKYEEWDNLINLNLSINWKILKSIEPLLLKSKQAKIFFISNTQISQGYPYFHAYSVAKAGLEAMANIYSREKEKFQVEIKIINLKSIKIGLLRKFFSNISQEEKKDLEKKIDLLVSNIVSQKPLL
tara:strand:- start:1036 stop:1719 length:684 start_codon:yes stop_codon:yes gene_type:complete